MAQNDGAQAFQADATGGKTIEELQAENERLRQQATTNQRCMTKMAAWWRKKPRIRRTLIRQKQ